MMVMVKCIEVMQMKRQYGVSEVLMIHRAAVKDLVQLTY